jgi:hypothetical protein
MSFLSVLKSIGSIFSHIGGIVTPLEPVIGIIPGGGAFNAIFNAVVNTEAIFQGAASGTASAAKKAVATTIVNATSPAPIEPAVLSTGIDQVVSALNSLHAASIPLTPPAPAAAA